MTTKFLFTFSLRQNAMLSPPRSPYTLSDRCRVMAHQLGSVAVQTHSVSPALSDFAPLHSPPPASPSSGFRALLAEEHSAGDGNTLGLSMSYDSPLSPSPSAEFGSALMEIDESEEEDEGDAVSKDGARTPVYRSSAEPLEGEFPSSGRANDAKLTPGRCRLRVEGGSRTSGNTGDGYVLASIFVATTQSSFPGCRIRNSSQARASTPRIL